ncbi:MAG TPA: hypothetical protein VK581_05535 [Chthoniobacterales bacterium]|nr:hypothetical protein [Chthoniobacterales bacterium]
MHPSSSKSSVITALFSPTGSSPVQWVFPLTFEFLKTETEKFAAASA